MIRAIKPYQIIVAMLAGIMLVNGFLRFNPVRIAIGTAAGLVFWFLLSVIGMLVIVNKNIKLYKVLDKYGFSMEYLRVYEQERITNKPFKIQYALEYAEIFMNIGKPDEAIKYLNTLTIPPNANIGFQAEYFFIYVKSALKIGNLAIAEDMWSRSSALISQITANPQNASFGYLVVLPMIYTDCFAARQNGDKTRLERALKQTEEFINSAVYRTYWDNWGGFAFEIIRLYELRELGMTDKYNALLPEVRSKIENSERLFTCLKTMGLENLTQIENGEFPI